MDALTCGVASIPGARPVKPTSMSPKSVRATSRVESRGSIDSWTSAE